MNNQDSQIKVQNLDGFRGEICYDEPMHRHTSWRVGGFAQRYCRPVDIDDLCYLLGALPAGEDIFWLGLGSNLLVRDGGIPGTVICTSGVLNNISHKENRVDVDAGVACAKIARYCARNQLAGAEFLVGIPGTMGGALAMNAGAFGGETWEIVHNVTTVDRAGNRNVRTSDEYTIAYREVIGPQNEWFVSATLELKKGDSAKSLSRIKELLDRRQDTQPMGQFSSGSVFKNPENDFAGRLIEASGLKGYCIGGACVSEKHGNFIVNTGNATAADIEALIIHVADSVEKQQGVRLIPEVRIVGEGSV